MWMSCGKGAFVTGKIDHQRSDFFGRGDAAHGLARHKLFQRGVLAAQFLAQGVNAIMPAWRFNGAGADAIAADAFGDIINRH